MFKNFSNYEIFEDGRIWSKKSKKFLKPHTRPDGYQQVGLTDNNGKRHVERLHKVVYFAVNGLWEYPEGMQINHKNESKASNQIANLELVSAKQNINHGTRTERAAKALTNHLEMSKRVGAFKDGVLQMVFPSTMEAERLGFKHSAVSKCCNGKFNREGNNFYKGFEWKFLDE